MMKLAVIFGALVAVTLVSTGCGSTPSAGQQANATPAGTVKETTDYTKNGQPKAKGMSPNDLTPPPGGGEAQFGTKAGGK